MNDLNKITIKASTTAVTADSADKSAIPLSSRSISKSTSKPSSAVAASLFQAQRQILTTVWLL